MSATGYCRLEAAYVEEESHRAVSTRQNIAGVKEDENERSSTENHNSVAMRRRVLTASGNAASSASCSEAVSITAQRVRRSGLAL